MPDPEQLDALIDACESAARDALRSVVYFTRDGYEQLYLRDYLSADADIQSFVENERIGFDRRPTHAGSELGRYEYTIHRFEHGYLIRVIGTDQGVFVTTNQMPIEQYDAVAEAIRETLISMESP